MYWQCNTSQYIIEILGCITRCIVMYSLMYQDVFGEVFGFMSRRGMHLNTSVNTTQYIVEYIIIPLKYIPIHLWCIGMLIHPKNIWYIQNTCQYISIHPVHPPRFVNAGILNPDHLDNSVWNAHTVIYLVHLGISQYEHFILGIYWVVLSMWFHWHSGSVLLHFRVIFKCLNMQAYLFHHTPSWSGVQSEKIMCWFWLAYTHFIPVHTCVHRVQPSIYHEDTKPRTTELFRASW
jgi:hypothetical protein